MSVAPTSSQSAPEADPEAAVPTMNLLEEQHPRRKGNHVTNHDRWVEVFYDNDARWHWRTISGRGNLPDIDIKGASRGYRWKRGAVRAARRENPGIVVRVVLRY